MDHALAESGAGFPIKKVHSVVVDAQMHNGVRNQRFDPCVVPIGPHAYHLLADASIDDKLVPGRLDDEDSSWRGAFDFGGMQFDRFWSNAQNRIAPLS